MAKNSNNIVLSATIQQDFDINFGVPLREFSTEFATAYEAKSKTPPPDKAEFYALIYNKPFPADLDRLDNYKNIKDKNIQQLIEFGKIQATRGEALCCIFKKPLGEKLSSLIQRAPLEENFVLLQIFRQVAAAITVLHDHNVLHGSINCENIYLNPQNANITVRECVSEFVGYSQKPVYEPLERMVCHKAGKSYREYSADFYACGVMVAELVSGGGALVNVPDNVIIKRKFEVGSYDAILNISRANINTEILPKTEILLRGLLHDKTRERWQTKQVNNWQRKEFTQPAPSRVHRQANTAFTFEGVEYFSPKYLAYVLQQNWTIAKKTLKLPDLVRWISFTSRLPEVEKRLVSIIRGQAEIILPDEKIARMIYILDDEGPIRYKDIAFHPDGLGNLFAYFMIYNDQQSLEGLITAIDNSYIEGWITNQENQDNYKPNILGYHPRKIKHYLRKHEMGFGIERCLYELNPYLPCLSPLLEATYSVGLPSVLTALNQPNRITGKDLENDKHLTAYICFQTDVEDAIKIKSLQRYPFFYKSIPIRLCAMFALAQQKSGIDRLNNITAWFRAALAPVLEKFNSVSLRRKVTENLDNAVATGNIEKVFQAIADSKLIGRDANGFAEAKRTYKILSFETLKLQSQANLDQLAYRMGLRVAVIFAYLICTVAILSVVFFNFSGKH